MTTSGLLDRWASLLRQRRAELAGLPRPERLRRLETELKDGLARVSVREREALLGELETTFPTGATAGPAPEEPDQPASVLNQVGLEELLRELQQRLTRLSPAQQQEIAGRLLPTSAPPPPQPGFDGSGLLAALKTLSDRSRQDFDPLCNDRNEVSRGGLTTEQHVAEDFANALAKTGGGGGRAPSNQNEARRPQGRVSVEQLGGLVSCLLVEAGCLTRLAERGLEQVVEHAFKPVNGLIDRAGTPALEGEVARWWAGAGQTDPASGLRAGTGLIKCLLHWYAVPWNHVARLVERLNPGRIEDHAPDRVKAGMFGRTSPNYKVLWETFLARYWATVSELADRPVDRETPDALVEIKEAFGQKIAAELAESYGWRLTTTGR